MAITNRVRDILKAVSDEVGRTLTPKERAAADYMAHLLVYGDQLKERTMQLEKVESSNLWGVHYDAETNVLHVGFKDRKTGELKSTYEYRAVPPEVYKAMMCAASIGQFFERNIKSSYQFRKLDDVAHEKTGTA